MLQQTSKFYAQEAMKCVDRYDCHDYMIKVGGDGHGGWGWRWVGVEVGAVGVKVGGRRHLSSCSL